MECIKCIKLDKYGYIQYHKYLYKRGTIIETWYKNRDDGIPISCYSKMKVPSGLIIEEYSELILGALYARWTPPGTAYINENFTIEEIERRIKITKGEI